MQKGVDSTLFVAEGENYRRAGTKEAAIDLLKRGLTVYPNYAPAHLVLGQCYFETGDLNLAKEEFLKVLELDLENILAYQFLAKIYSQLGEERLLNEVYQTILQLDPFHTEAKAYLERAKAQRIPFATVAIAELYEAQGHLTEALKIYQELLRREPENESIRDRIDTLLAKIRQ